MYKIVNVLISLDFIKVIDQLFDEKVLIGSGWTARETIRFVMLHLRNACPLNLETYLNIYRIRT